MKTQCFKFPNSKILFGLLILVSGFSLTLMSFETLMSSGAPVGMALIPAGEFQMGNSGQDAEKPVHSVYVDAFYMDKYEVTNAEYAAFLNAQGKHADAERVWLDIGGWGRIVYAGGAYRVEAGYEHHPVIAVSWYGAMAYAAWVGKRLPTEAEWEKAARGGLSGQVYPWGNTINSSRANYDDNIGGTTVVGKYPSNGYGLYDMAGNVWEWCLDEYNDDFYAISPARNPLSGANSIKWLLDNYTGVRSNRVVRGGSWLHFAVLVRVALRGDGTPSLTSLFLGFRCARAVTPDGGGPSPPAPDSFEGMVLIPAGEFQMGSNSRGYNAKPVHSVYVDAFYMDKYEVTNAEYAVFLNAQGRHVDAERVWYDIEDEDARIGYVGGVYRAQSGYEHHPVVEVSWYGAMAYAAWVGKRLPTEAEWEKAARGGLSGQVYPWGNTIDPTRANYGGRIGGTTAVGKYPSNGYGLYDMAGNVWEWCLDEGNWDSYAISPARNPLSGANSIKWLLDNYTGVRSGRVVRGGSWFLYDSGSVRVAGRNPFLAPTNSNDFFGFRCVRAVTP